MTKKYNNRPSSKQSGSIPHQLLVLMVTFVLGYLTASFFDVPTISAWIRTQVLAHHPEQKPVEQKKETQTEVSTKPKFEFYTLLANDKVGGVAQTNAHAAVDKAMEASVAASTAQVRTAQNPVKNENVHTQTPPIEVPAKVVERKVQEPVPVPKGTYAVQVASFKARKDAEHMKGMLILKGFHVTVVPVTQAQGNWFRVIVGPYADRNTAQKTQFSLERNERLRGMIVRTAY